MKYEWARDTNVRINKMYEWNEIEFQCVSENKKGFNYVSTYSSLVEFFENVHRSQVEKSTKMAFYI